MLHNFKVVFTESNVVTIVIYLRISAKEIISTSAYADMNSDAHQSKAIRDLNISEQISRF